MSSIVEHNGIWGRVQKEKKKLHPQKLVNI